MKFFDIFNNLNYEIFIILSYFHKKWKDFFYIHEDKIQHICKQILERLHNGFLMFEFTASRHMNMQSNFVMHPKTSFCMGEHTSHFISVTQKPSPLPQSASLAAAAFFENTAHIFMPDYCNGIPHFSTNY